MVKRIPVSARISGCALSAAFLVLGCAGCTATAKPTAAQSAAVSVPAATATAAPSAATASATTPTSAQPVHLVADATVRHELLATFIAFRRNGANTAPGFAAIPPSAVAGIAPRTLHYAYDPATGTYWAVADFSPTEAASQTAAFIGFQDGGNAAVFTQPPGGSWRVKSVGPCMAGLPVSVRDAMKLTASPFPGCQSPVPAG